MKTGILKQGDGFEIKYTVHQYGYMRQYINIQDDLFAILALIWPFRFWFEVKSFDSLYKASQFKQKLDSPKIKEVVEPDDISGDCARTCNCEIGSACKKKNDVDFVIIKASNSDDPFASNLIAFRKGKKIEL